MERTAMDAAARWRPYHDRNTRPPPIAALGGEVDDLVVAAGDEVGELHFGDGPEPHEARAYRSPHNGRFGNRGIDHALLAESLEKSGRDLECAAVDADVLADQEHARVALHLLPDPFADRLQVGC